MKRFSAAVVMAVAGVGVLTATLPGQEPRYSSYPITPLPMPASQPMVPAPVGPAAGPRACKICVSECVPTTKKVYSCKCEEYCLPRCGCLSFLVGDGCGCGHDNCGDVKVRRRLVIRRVPDCDKKICVLRDAPVGCLLPPEVIPPPAKK